MEETKEQVVVNSNAFVAGLATGAALVTTSVAVIATSIMNTKPKSSDAKTSNHSSNGIVSAFLCCVMIAGLACYASKYIGDATNKK